ncbi:MAG TPA: tetratricopeptide repeat protein, partial [Thermoanaerobaculia bacterium]|nr:tetratricopeptide repeat protein [Thermoanaerobaculia bacterium]
GDWEGAVAAYRRCLEIDPTNTRSYLSLGRLLLSRGEREEALRWLRHGARAAAQPELVAGALREAEAGATEN